MLPAARVDDTVIHEDWTDMTVAPAGLGVAIVVTIAIVATGGTAALAFAIGGGITTIAGLIDKLFFDPGPEKIVTGADTVFTNLRASALAHPKCTVEDGNFVLTGALHVYLEEGRASRFDDKTTCPGKIVTGSEPPWEMRIGGPPAPPSPSPDWYRVYLVADLAYSAIGLLSAWRSAASDFDNLQNVYDTFTLGEGIAEFFGQESPLAHDVRDAVDSGRSLYSGIGGLREILGATR